MRDFIMADDPVDRQIDALDKSLNSSTEIKGNSHENLSDSSYDDVKNSYGKTMEEQDQISTEDSKTEKDNVPKHSPVVMVIDDVEPKVDDTLLGNDQKRENGVHDTVITLDKADDTTQKQKSGSSSTCRRRLLAWLKKNEYLVLILGSVTFLLGCIVLAIGAYMMQARDKCHVQSPLMSEDGMNPVYSVPSTMATLPIPSPSVQPSDVNSTDGAEYNVTSQQTEVVANVTDVVVYGKNLALGRPAYQSSTVTETGMPYHASLATDGGAVYMFSGGSCARTEIESRPYWYVDLGSLQLVKIVKLYSPRDLPAGELHNFEVRIGQEEELRLNPLCRYYMGTALIFAIHIQCERPMYGRYVSIELLGDVTRPQNRITLCEVQVYNN